MLFNFDTPELLQLRYFLHTKQYPWKSDFSMCTTGIEDDHLCLSLPDIYEGILDLSCPQEQFICLHIELLLNY